MSGDDPHGAQSPAGIRRSDRGHYRRERDLPRLLPLWPHEIADRSLAGHRHLVERLARALRTERRRGLKGDWTYDLARHRALLAAWRDERNALARREQSAGPDTG